MNRRVFWQIPECIKFRTIFEDKETILGASENDEHRLFRKDTGNVCFTGREAPESFMAMFLEREFSEESEEVYV